MRGDPEPKDLHHEPSVCRASHETFPGTPGDKLIKGIWEPIFTGGTDQITPSRP